MCRDLLVEARSGQRDPLLIALLVELDIDPHHHHMVLGQQRGREITGGISDDRIMVYVQPYPLPIAAPPDRPSAP